MPKKSAKQATARKAANTIAATKTTAIRKTAAKKKTAAQKRPSRKPTAAKFQPLPRPMITAEEKLFLLFKDDYHARQIFDFLRAETVGELEQFTPRAIVSRLSKPIEDAVERIRHKLAEKNRYL